VPRARGRDWPSHPEGHNALLEVKMEEERLGIGVMGRARDCPGTNHNHAVFFIGVQHAYSFAPREKLGEVGENVRGAVSECVAKLGANTKEGFQPLQKVICELYAATYPSSFSLVLRLKSYISENIARLRRNSAGGLPWHGLLRHR
jgi:hypothetical protein